MAVVARALRFAVVGAVASAVHFTVVVLLVRGADWTPPVANVAGFAVAFVVSFVGQWRWTFASGAPHWQHALPRYFLVSVAAFAVNAASYALLLRYAPLRFDVALALVLIAVAGATFVLSRAWAFRPPTQP